MITFYIFIREPSKKMVTPPQPARGPLSLDRLLECAFGFKHENFILNLSYRVIVYVIVKKIIKKLYLTCTTGIKSPDPS